MNTRWTKHDDWTPHGGPWYRHESGRVAVSGGYGTLGDNVRGWKKTRLYHVILTVDGQASVQSGSYRTVAKAQKAAERLLSDC